MPENTEKQQQHQLAPSPTFAIPPKPILNKSDQRLPSHQDTLPKLQTNIQQPRPVVVDSPTVILTTPINQNPPSIQSTPSGLKHTNSISFNVPSGVEKSHRGSISARPSQVNIGGNGYPKVASPSSGGAQRPQLPGNKDNGIRNPSTSSIQFDIPPQQQQQQQQQPPSATLQRKTSPSPFSSRQGSSNGDYLQFVAKSSSGIDHHHDSRSNSISSNASFQSPSSIVGSDFSDPHPAIEIPQPQKKSKNALKAIVASPTGPVVPFTQYLQREDDKKIHILIGATGSVATIKVPLIIDKLQKIYGPDKVSIQLVVTKPAEHFLRGSKISTEVKIWRDSDEWSNTFGKPGDPILHVELRKWADIFLLAPLSANTLAKIANGLCDNLLTSIIRSWNPTVPVLTAPAMNTLMYTHPMTKKHLNILHEDFKFITVLRPVEKVLVCGDIGMGGMREWTDIVDTVMRKIKEIKLAKIASLEGAMAEVEEEEEEEEDDDEDDEDYRDDEDDDEDDSNDDSNSDEYDDDDDDDELDMELEDNPELLKGSVDNLGHHLSNVLSLTGDPVTDHRFNSTTNLI